MSRISSNQTNEKGHLINGYDYDLQVWVINGMIQRCGHKDQCACNGKRFEGVALEKVASQSVIGGAK
jgi:hypothetical protein